MTGPTRAEFHPRWLRRRTSTYWWLERWPYVAFITRELSSVFVAWFVIFLLLFVRAVRDGPAHYSAFLDWAADWRVVVLNAVGMFFLIFHAVTWFNLAPRAMVLYVARRRVPGALVAAGNYAGWAVVTAVILWLVLRA
jgi:fumarate reductase subunit C